MMHFVLRNDGFIQIVEGIEIMDALQGTDPVRPRADVFVAFLSHFWWTFLAISALLLLSLGSFRVENFGLILCVFVFIF